MSFLLMTNNFSITSFMVPCCIKLRIAYAVSFKGIERRVFRGDAPRENFPSGSAMSMKAVLTYSERGLFLLVVQATLPHSLKPTDGAR